MVGIGDIGVLGVRPFGRNALMIASEGVLCLMVGRPLSVYISSSAC